MLEAQAVLQGGRQAYFAGERVCVHITFKNIHPERDETILWASAQLYCVLSLAKRYVNVGAVSQIGKSAPPTTLAAKWSNQSSSSPTTDTHTDTNSSTEKHGYNSRTQYSHAVRDAHISTRINTQTQSTKQAVALSTLYALPQAIVCSDIRLGPGSSSGTYCYVAQIPIDATASNSGVAIRVQHRVAVSFQRKNGTTAQLTLPVRVFVLPEKVREWVSQAEPTQLQTALNQMNVAGSDNSPGDTGDASYQGIKQNEKPTQTPRNRAGGGEWVGSDEESERASTGLDMSEDDQQVWMDVIPALDMLSEQVAGIGSFDDTEGIFQKVITRAKSRLRARDRAYMKQQKQLAQEMVDDDGGVDIADGAGVTVSRNDGLQEQGQQEAIQDSKRESNSRATGGADEHDKELHYKVSGSGGGGAQANTHDSSDEIDQEIRSITSTATQNCTAPHTQNEAIKCVSHTGDISVGLWADTENMRWLKHRLQRLQAYVMHERRTKRFRIGGSESRVGMFTLFKPSYCLGEEVMGEFDFSDATLSTYMVKVSLEATELVKASLEVKGQPKPQTTHHSTQWVHTHNVVRSPLRLSVPLSVSPTYASDLVTYEWCLHIEFTTNGGKPYAMETVSADNGDIITHTAPQTLDVRTFTWRLPLQLLPSNPLNFNEIKRPSIKQF